MSDARRIIYMNKQTIAFAVQKKDSIVTKIGRSYIRHPEIKFTGSGVKWCGDRPKQPCGNANV